MMNNQNKHIPTQRENLLLVLLNKVFREYKSLLLTMRKTKPYKIIEISRISNTPGETEFVIQITNKNAILKITAADIICNNYDLTDFTPFHQELIVQAAKGALATYLKLKERKPTYMISSKKYDKQTEEYVFTIESNYNTYFKRTGLELSKDDEILAKMYYKDIYDVGYSNGMQSICNEKNIHHQNT